MGLSWARRVLGLVVLAAGHAGAQRVTLQIKPHLGDTLRMRLDQQSEITGVRRTKQGESSALVTNSLRMFSRAIVERTEDKATTLLAVTDSVIVATSDERARAAADSAEAQMRGERIRFRVSPDGTVGVNEDGQTAAPREVAQVVSLMPAAFPKEAVGVGETWDREMALPLGGQLGAQLSGKLHVTFRLDSVTHHHNWAFVSMRGELEPASGPGAASGTVVEKGMVTGTMLVDQKRGWLTESWFNILVNSMITPPPSTGLLSMHVQIRMTQHMQTTPRH